MGSYPGGYRPLVQRNMKYVAETLANGVNPYTPPYPDFYSTAGGNLHGVAGAPFKLIFEFPQASRLGVFIMGLCSLIVFYFILKKIGVRSYICLTSVSFLMIYPQYILVFSQGNPAAADIFFGVISVYTYLHWRAVKSRKWIFLSSIGAGLATFSHFYSGVVGIGIILHYISTKSKQDMSSIRLVFFYAVGMLPALGLLITYKFVFSVQDPNSHYFDRLIFNSFHEVYVYEDPQGNPISMYSVEFLKAIFRQHGVKSPIFGNWWISTITTVVLSSSYIIDTDEKGWKFVSTWIFAGLLIVLLIPGGVLGHDYYTWWLLMGVIAGLSLSVESAVSSIERNFRTKRISFPIFTLVLVLTIIIQSVASPHSVIG
jgi:hypothetical protein